MHKNGPQFLKNYASLASRNAIIPNSGSFATFLDFDTETGTAWQAWVFNDAVGGGGIAHVRFGLQGGYGANADITVTAGPDSGDLVTGTGPCIVGVNVRGGAPANLSVWFTPEQTVRALPPRSIVQTSLGAAATRNDFGFPPFGRYNCQILTTANYTLELEVGNTGVIVTNATLTPNTFLDDAFSFFHQPQTKLFVTGSVNNQPIQISHFE